ncbi:S1C family serine protease [Streptomyces silvensis]|uniref:Protease n=1 Tax=Streptomyces silvensis TaxID=1765722 RepID=A0A0W7WYS2_9ACTN|nr:trypsin-like peptidase domain-containing protein [Streptomyces silvensis]KUF15716.1 protease [Streptomyces silvensis]
MSTENEGTEVPPAPSAPPVPVDTPAASAPDASAQQPPEPSGGAAAPSGATAAGGEPAAPGPAPAQAPAPAAPPAQAPSAPAPTPAPSVPDPYAHTAAHHGAGQNPTAHPGAGHTGAGHPATGRTTTTQSPVGAWPPPPPPAVPTYAQDGGHGGGAGSGWGASWTAEQPSAPKPSGRRGGLVAAVLAAALIAGGVGGGLGFWAADRNDDGGTDSTTVSASDSPADLKRQPGSVAAIANKALPSVVTIEAQSGSGEGGTGTGFVYDTQGHILTNNHVVASAAEGGKLSATFSNGKKYAAEVVGRAEGYDVAVIKLKDKPADLTPIPLANSDKVAVGDSTIAIGAPFGLSNTVTTGIVSAKNRPVTSSDGGNKSSYMSALQTDASINPGNSGGPLLDARGAVIGINSAIKPADSGGGLGGGGQSGSIGLGFAIPVNQAKNVAQQLIRTGEATYPVIGASVALAETSDGATISDRGAGGSGPAVEPGGPAAKAGLKSGDVIKKLDDMVIDSGPTLIGQIWTHKPGDTVKITYERDGKERTVDVVLGARKGDS